MKKFYIQLISTTQENNHKNNIGTHGYLHTDANETRSHHTPPPILLYFEYFKSTICLIDFFDFVTLIDLT